MRVLWFSNMDLLATRQFYNFENKGTGNWISSLEEQVKKINKIELAVAFHRSKNKKLSIQEYDNVNYYVLPSKGTSKIGKLFNNWYGKVDNTYEVDYYFKIIELFKPDVIHIFGFENSFVKILPQYKHITIIHIQGIQNVISHFLHGNFSAVELSKNSSFLNRIKGCSYQRISSRFIERATIESNAFKHCKYVFGRTEWDRRVLTAVAPQAKYFYCQEIMRDEFYHTTWYKARGEDIILYSTLNDQPYKGPDQIFHVASILQRFQPLLRYSWRIAGLDENSMCVKAMRNRGFKKTPSLHFLGRLSAREIVEEMQQSDMFVYPSLIENGCNAVQEAMLLGMPIVCTSAGGMATTITNNETGLLVQPGDPYAMAGAIIDLINNFELATKLGVKAREEASVRHDRRNIVSIVLKTYEGIAWNSNLK